MQLKPAFRILDPPLLTRRLRCLYVALPGWPSLWRESPGLKQPHSSPTTDRARTTKSTARSVEVRSTVIGIHRVPKILDTNSWRLLRPILTDF